MTIGVLLADDDLRFLRHLHEMIKAQPDMRVEFAARNGLEAARRMSDSAIDVALLDVRMPQVSGVQLAEYAHEKRLPVHVVLLTTFEHEDSLRRSMQADVAGFLTKDAAPETILQSIRAAYSGAKVFTELPTELMGRGYIRQATVGEKDPGFAAVLDDLPPFLISVLDLLMHGKSNAAIAKSLHLKESTVKSYVSQLLAATECSSRSDLAIKALRCGYAPPEASHAEKRWWERLKL